jgi:hypothetical protein
VRSAAGESEVRYLFHSGLRTFFVGCRLVEYLNLNKAGVVFAAYRGIALQETHAAHRVNFYLSPGFMH